MKNNRKEFPHLQVVSTAQWAELSRKKIYFGHQSVGQNIIESLGEIMMSFSELKLEIRETYSPIEFSQPLLGHSFIGYNRDPRSKIDHFKKLMENGLGDQVDIAFFKFCYVDIVADTNIEKVFSEYSDCLAYLKNKYPKVHFPAITVPLVTKPNSMKTILMKSVGKKLRTETDSLRRNVFNDALRNKFSDGLFDLAKHESTFIGGDQSSMYLVPEYTDDGGHLNSAGRKVIGSQFILFLIKEIEQSISTTPDN